MWHFSWPSLLTASRCCIASLQLMSVFLSCRERWKRPWTTVVWGLIYLWPRQSPVYFERSFSWLCLATETWNLDDLRGKCCMWVKSILFLQTHAPQIHYSQCRHTVCEESFPLNEPSSLCNKKRESAGPLKETCFVLHTLTGEESALLTSLAWFISYICR